MTAIRKSIRQPTRTGTLKLLLHVLLGASAAVPSRRARHASVIAV